MSGSLSMDSITSLSDIELLEDQQLSMSGYGRGFEEIDGKMEAEGEGEEQREGGEGEGEGVTHKWVQSVRICVCVYVRTLYIHDEYRTYGNVVMAVC